MKTALLSLIFLPFLAGCEARYSDSAPYNFTDRDNGFTDRDDENRGGDPHNPGMAGIRRITTGAIRRSIIRLCHLFVIPAKAGILTYPTYKNWLRRPCGSRFRGNDKKYLHTGFNSAISGFYAGNSMSNWHSIQSTGINSTPPKYAAKWFRSQSRLHGRA